MKTKTEEQIEKQISDINLQILQLTELQNLCLTLNKEGDTELLDLLGKNYELDEEITSKIISMVKGKKKANTVDSKMLERLKRKFDSYCVICNMNTTTKDNKEFMGYAKFSNKCSNKKNILNKKLNESTGESSSEPTNPSETTPV